MEPPITDPIRPVTRVEGKKPPRHPPRTCSVDDCTIRLSKYNPGPDCYQHTPLKYPRTRKKGAPR